MKDIFKNIKRWATTNDVATVYPNTLSASKMDIYDLKGDKVGEYVDKEDRPATEIKLEERMSL